MHELQWVGIIHIGVTQADSVRPSRDEGDHGGTSGGEGDYGGTMGGLQGVGGHRGTAKGLSRLSPPCGSVSVKNSCAIFQRIFGT